MQVLIDHSKKNDLAKGYANRIEEYFNTPGQVLTVYGILKAVKPEIIGKNTALSSLDYYLVALEGRLSSRASYSWAFVKLRNETHTWQPTDAYPIENASLKEMTLIPSKYQKGTLNGSTYYPCIWLPAYYTHVAANKYAKHLLQNPDD